MVTTTNKDPAFLFYATAWLQSEKVRAMTLEERGAYVELLAFSWLHRSIPADPKAIRSLLGLSVSRFASVWGTLSTCWVPKADEPGRLVNERQEHEREERRRLSEERRSRGAAGGKQTAKQDRIRTAAGPPVDGPAEGQAERQPSTSTTYVGRKEGPGLDPPAAETKQEPGSGSPPSEIDLALFDLGIFQRSPLNRAGLAAALLAEAWTAQDVREFAATIRGRDSNERAAFLATALRDDAVRSDWRRQRLAGGAMPEVSTGVAHIPNMPLGTASCGCSGCVQFRSKRTDVPA
ncbi:MAG: hypothetical protein WBO45_24115 [Planctomycetota bacterium]